MHNIKLCCGTLIVFASVLLSGCRQEPVLETTIPGLDLSKLQDQDYFRDRLEPTREFVAWCNKTMVEPIPDDKTSRLFLGTVKWHLMLPFWARNAALKQQTNMKATK